MFWIYRDGGGSITTVELGQVSLNITFFSLRNWRKLVFGNFLNIFSYLRDNMHNSSFVAENKSSLISNNLCQK